MSTPHYSLQWLKNLQNWRATIDQERVTVAENQLFGLYEYVGQGVVDGWHVVSHNSYDLSDEDALTSDIEFVTQAEVNALSTTTKNGLANLDYKMILRLTSGNGIVGPWTGITAADSYFAIQKEASSKAYYVYAVPTLSIQDANSHRATFLVTEDATYDTDNYGVYLATVSTYYDPITKIVQISNVAVDDNRRIELYQFKGLATDEIRKAFLMHVHDGRSAPKISLTTQDILQDQTDRPLGSPIHLIDNITLVTNLNYGPEILSEDIEYYNNGPGAGTWYYAVTFLINNGKEIVESLTGNVVSVTLLTGQGVKLTWSKVVGAIGYKVYRTEKANDGNRRLYLIQDEYEDFIFTDDGASVILPRVSPPEPGGVGINDIEFDGAADFQYITSGDDLYTVNDANVKERLGYVMLGAHEELPVLRPPKIVLDSDNQTYNRAEVRLNGVALNANDYKLIRADGTSGVIELKNNITNENSIEVILHINPTETQVTDTLKSSRVESLDASFIAYGQIPKRFLTPPNHYGMQRVREACSTKPYIDLRTSDYTIYTPQDPNAYIQFDEEIKFIGRCFNAHKNYGVPTKSYDDDFGSQASDFYMSTASDSTTQTSGELGGGTKKWLIGTKKGTYVTENFMYFEKLASLPEDDGYVIDSVDNMVFGNDLTTIENVYFETYVLLNTGKIYYSTDNLQTWTEITYPTTDFFATAFHMSTRKSQVFVQNKSTYKYHRVFYIGGYNSDLTELGMWKADLLQDLSIDDINWEIEPYYQSRPCIVYDIEEIITYTTVDSPGYALIEQWPRTVYAATSNGMIVDGIPKVNSAYPSMVPKKLLWINTSHLSATDSQYLPQGKENGSKNDLMVIADDSVFISHGALHRVYTSGTASVDTWDRPLTKKIDRLYKIADATDFSAVEITGIGESRRYFVLGTDDSGVRYGIERAALGSPNTEIPSSITVLSSLYSASIPGAITVESQRISDYIEMRITVEADLEADVVLAYPDEQYAEYFGWDMTQWNNTLNSERVRSANSIYSIGDIKQYGKTPPLKEPGIGRTGSLSGTNYNDSLKLRYIGCNYTVDGTEITIDFDNGTSIVAINDSSLEDTGTGEFEIDSKLIWILLKQYMIVEQEDPEDKTKTQIVFSRNFDTTLGTPPPWQDDQATTATTQSVSIQASSDTLGPTGEAIVETTIELGNSVIIGGNNGIWHAEYNDGTAVKRTYNIFTPTVDPEIYLNNTVIAEATYAIHGIAQEIEFVTAQDPWDVFMVEKDYKEYFINGGKWEGNTDILVFVNNKPSLISWQAYPDIAMIRFDQSLSKDDTVAVTILNKSSYINDVGTIPHSEIPSTYVTSDTIYTKLSRELTEDNEIIVVADNTDFPSNTQFIEINSERIAVEIIDKRTFKAIYPRNAVSIHPAKSIVYLVEVKSLLGIEDRLSMATSYGQTYNLNSVYLANQQLSTMALRQIYTNITDSQHEVVGSTMVNSGPINSLYHNFDTEMLDELNSFTTKRIGLDPADSSEPAITKIVMCWYKEIAPKTVGSLIGTDSGIWKLDTDGIWRNKTRCDGASRIYCIEKFRGDIWAGADNGVWISEDNGETWTQNALYYQSMFNIKSGKINWSKQREEVNATETNTTEDKYYEAFVKDDGIIVVLYDSRQDGSGDFASDQATDLDGIQTYTIAQNEIVTPIAQTISRSDSFYVATDKGMWLLSNSRKQINNADYAYSDFISDVDVTPIDNRNFNYRHINQDGTAITEDIKVYDFFLDPRIPDQAMSSLSKYDKYGNGNMILLTNDGVKVSRNWFLNKDGSTSTLTWAQEPLKGLGYTCYCHVCVADPNADYSGAEAWLYSKIFIGTNKGVLMSIDGGLNWNHCNKITDKTTTIFNLAYENNTLYAFTNHGLFESTDLGITWTSNATFFLSEAQSIGTVAQTFRAEETDITKVSLWLVPQQTIYTNDYPNYIQVSLYDTVGGIPTTLIDTSSTIYYVHEINEKRWYTFDLPVSLTLYNTYAIVVEEVLMNNDQPIGKIGAALSMTDSYSYGRAMYYDIDWIDIDGTSDLFFLVHYDAVPAIEYTTTTVEYSIANGNNVVVTSDSRIAIETRHFFSFVIDGTGTMQWNDALGLRKSKVLEFAQKLLARAQHSYIDLWVFDNKTRSLLGNIPTNNIITLTSAINAIVSNGTDSEVWDGSSRAVSNAAYEGIYTALEEDAQFDFVVDYMESNLMIDHAALMLIDSTYTGNYQDLKLEQYATLRLEVINDYIDTFIKHCFIFTDGNDSSSSETSADLAMTVDAIKEIGQVKLYMFGLGANNNQTEMISACQETGGTFFNASENIFDDAFEELLNGQFYLWQGIYEGSIDFGDEIKYINTIECPAVIPDTSSATFEMRFTKDYRNWTAWTTYNFNEALVINAFVNVIEYRFTLKEGDAVAGDPTYLEYETDDYGIDNAFIRNYPSPVIYPLEYTVATPVKNVLVTEPQDGANIFEFILSYYGTIPDTSAIEWKLVNGDILRLDTYQDILTNKKSVLPIRSRSTKYYPSITSDKIAMIPADSTGFLWAAFSGTTPLTWTDADTVKVYVSGVEIVSNIQYNYRDLPSFGMIEFLGEPVIDPDTVEVVIVTPSSNELVLGEALLRINDFVFASKNGAWPCDARALVIRNGIAIGGGYELRPDEGIIVFNDYVALGEEIRLLIETSDQYRICILTYDYDDIPIHLEDFGFMFSTILLESETEILDTTNPPTIDNNLVILTSYDATKFSEDYIGTMYSIPSVYYSYNHEYGIDEYGTEIKWYRQRANETEFTEVTSLINYMTKDPSDSYDDLVYAPTALTGAGEGFIGAMTGLWGEGDAWKVSVQPYAINSAGESLVGAVYYSNEFKIGSIDEDLEFDEQIRKTSYHHPIITDLKVYQQITGTIPTTIDGDEATLTASNIYSYYGLEKKYAPFALRFAIVDEDPEHNIIDVLAQTIVKWYKNEDVTPTYDSSDTTKTKTGDKWTIPTESIKTNESWYAEIIPYDGQVYGPSIFTYRIEILPEK